MPEMPPPLKFLAPVSRKGNHESWPIRGVGKPRGQPLGGGIVLYVITTDEGWYGIWADTLYSFEFQATIQEMIEDSVAYSLSMGVREEVPGSTPIVSRGEE